MNQFEFDTYTAKNRTKHPYTKINKVTPFAILSAHTPFSSKASQMPLQTLVNASGADANPLVSSFSFAPFFFVCPATTNHMDLNCLAMHTIFPLKHTTNVPSSSSLRIILNFCP